MEPPCKLFGNSRKDPKGSEAGMQYNSGQIYKMLENLPGIRYIPSPQQKENTEKCRATD